MPFLRVYFAEQKIVNLNSNQLHGKYSQNNPSKMEEPKHDQGSLISQD
jgi:hypothetical protein